MSTLVHPLAGVGLGGEQEPIAWPRVVDAAKLAEARQAVRHLLQDVTGSTTGPDAVAAIYAATGKATLVVNLPPADLEKVRVYLERRRASKT